MSNLFAETRDEYRWYVSTSQSYMSWDEELVVTLSWSMWFIVDLIEDIWRWIRWRLEP